MIRRSLAYSWLGRQGQLIVQLVSLTVVARLLSPEEYGVFFTGAAIVAFITILSQFGQAEYLSQVDELTPERRGSAFGMSLAVWAGCTCVVAAALAAVPAGTIDATLQYIIIILCLSLGLEIFYQSITGVFERTLRFEKIFFFRMVRQVVAAAVTIALAASGIGALSLAWGIVADRLTGLSLAIWHRRLVGLVWPRFRAWGPVFRFGRFHSGSQILEEMRKSGSMLVVSQFLGFAATGLLSRAQRIEHLAHQAVIEGIGPAIVPALAHQQRAGGDLRSSYLTKLSYLSALAWPFALFTIVFAEPIVRLILGPNWGEAVPIVRILALVGIFAPFLNFIGKFYIVLDLLPTLWHRQLLANLGGLALVAGAAQWSLEWVAWATVGQHAIKAALTLGPIHHRLGCTLWMTLRALKASALITVAIAAAIGIFVIESGAPKADESLVLVATAAITTAVWLAGLIALQHPATKEIARAYHKFRVSWLPAANRPRIQSNAGSGQGRAQPSSDFRPEARRPDE